MSGKLIIFAAFAVLLILEESNSATVQKTYIVHPGKKGASTLAYSAPLYAGTCRYICMKLTDCQGYQVTRG